MKGFLFLTILIWLGLCEFIFSQNLTTKGVVFQPVPASHVLDEARLFHDHPESLAEIKNHLSGLKKKHGYPVYLAIYYNVYEGTLLSRAEALHKEWFGEEGHGMVIVYQLDPVISGDNPAVSYFKGSELDALDLLDPDADRKAQTGVIPSQEAAAMLTRAFKVVNDKREDHRGFLLALVSELDREISQYFEVKPVRWFSAENIKFMLALIALIAAIALVGMLLRWLLSRADAKSSKVYYFPEVEVACRLGAPFGGGWISEKTFVPASEKK